MSVSKQSQLYFYARSLSDTNLYLVSFVENQTFLYGQRIIINTEFGKNIAVICSFPFEEYSDDRKWIYHSGKLIRYLENKDLNLFINIQTYTREVKSTIEKIKIKLLLDMHITNILIPLDKKCIVIFYIAHKRVDFRQMLIEIKKKYKKRIVMRQISEKQRLKSYSLDPRNKFPEYVSYSYIESIKRSILF